MTFLLSLRDFLAETAHSIAVIADQLITKLEDRYVWVDDEPTCSTCNQPMDAPPCSLNRELGWSGHTVSGGVANRD